MDSYVAAAAAVELERGLGAILPVAQSGVPRADDFFGERSLRNATVQFVEHDHGERNRQGLGDKLIEPGEEVGQRTGEIERRERLSGLLSY